MLVTGTSASRGPKLANREKGVHIQRLTADTPETPGGTASAAPVPKNIGNPEPTDILVFNHQTWSFVGGHLHPHPRSHHDHPETILRLQAGKDRAVWWSEEPFRITLIEPSHLDPHPSGPPPFDALPSTEETKDVDGRRIYVARSSLPRDAAKHHFYKISFSIGGEDIDPDMEITP